MHEAGLTLQGSGCTMIKSRAIAATGLLGLGLAASAGVPAEAKAPDAAQRAAALQRLGLTRAQANSVQRDPARLGRMLRVVSVQADPPVAIGARRKRASGCLRRRTQVNYGFNRQTVAAYYRISIGWCWYKRAKRVVKDGPIRTDWNISSAAGAAGLRHESDQVRSSGYYRWKNAPRGGYLAQGELVLHFCPLGEKFGCSPTDRLVGEVFGHYDGSVYRRGYRG